MKIKLNHLAPYLSYGLRLQDDGGNNGKLVGLFEDCLNIRYDVNVGDYEISFEDIKPILRPMSDYNKFHDANEGYMSSITYNVARLELDKELDLTLETDSSTFYLPIMDCYETLQVLFKHHFDVFGLIEQGLAVDINTLN